MLEEIDAVPSRLNLGCGFDHREGYLNVDFEAAHEPDLLADVRTLETLTEASFTEILAQDVLEHLERTDAEPTLKRWNDLLAIGGTLTIRTPDIIGLSAMLSHHRDPALQFELLQNMFGTQAYTGDYHLNGFTESSLRSLLHTAGFHVVSIDRFDGWLLDCVAVKPEVLGSFELGPLPLMDMPTVGADPSPAPAMTSIDRVVSRVGAALPEGAAAPVRAVWRRVRRLTVGRSS